MQIFECDSFPIEQYVELDVLEQRLSTAPAAFEFPMRLLAYSRGFDMTPARTRLRGRTQAQQRLARAAQPLRADLATPGPADAWMLPSLTHDQQAQLRAALPHPERLDAAVAAPTRAHWQAVLDDLGTRLWTLPWLGELLRFYDTLETEFLRSAAYYTVTWEPHGLGAGALASTLQHATGRPVTPVDDLPSIIAGDYDVHATHLAPRRPGDPFLTVLFSTDMRGAITAEVLHQLMSMPFDLAVAIDIVTLPRSKALRHAELAYNASKAAISDVNIKDTSSERRMRDAEAVQHLLMHQGFHEVGVAVLVSGRTREELVERCATISNRMGSRLRLTRVTGHTVQAAALQLWSTTPAKAIPLPWKRRNMLSPGVGCLFGILGFHRSRNTDGIMWGIDAMRSSPLFFDLFADNQAAHQVILGETGYGKTVFLNTIALRAAAAGYRVIGMDAFRNGDRVARAARGGARCYSLGLDLAINLLDVVMADEDTDTPGSWLGRQVSYVTGQLALLLGEPGMGPDGKRYLIPRAFSIAERGVLDRALSTTYETWGVDATAPVCQMPLLSDVVRALEAMHEPEARHTARDLRMLIFGSDDPSYTKLTQLGRTFNRHTEVNWNFDTFDITYFDFDRLKDTPELLPLFYAYAIGAFLRWMRHPGRDRRRKVLLQLDEFGYAAQVVAVLLLAVEITKTARKYGVGLMLIDQNPGTFLESASGRAILENAAATILFHLKDAPARQMAEAFSVLTPMHVQAIIEAPKGECVAVVRQDTYRMTVQLNPKEERALIGS